MCDIVRKDSNPWSPDHIVRIIRLKDGADLRAANEIGIKFDFPIKDGAIHLSDLPKGFSCEYMSRIINARASQIRTYEKRHLNPQGIDDFLSTRDIPMPINTNGE
jgi:hypothetical protein